MKQLTMRRSMRHKGEILLEIKQGIGLTRDFSSSGLYFFTDQPVVLGEKLDLVMVLDHQNRGQTIRVRCQADVIRVERNADKAGVAVSFSHYFSRPAGDAPPHHDDVIT